MPKNLIPNVLGYLILITFVSSCSSTPKVETLEIKSTPVEKPVLILPKAEEIKTRDIEWIIISPQNQEEVFSDLYSKNKSVTIFGLTSEGYENISKNMNDIRRYIEQQDSIIESYENYYIRANRALENAVTIE